MSEVRTESPPTTGPLLVACGAAFIAFLDLSVVNIAFPAIARDFPGTSTATLTWVVSGYAVAFAALLTPGGRLADALGRRRVFLGALLAFALTSALCALAPNAATLVAGRIAQGASAALMVPAALGLVLAASRPERIGAAMGAWSAAGGFAAVVGPAVGGGLVELFGWPAVFLVNVPVVAILIAAVLRVVPADTHRDGRWPDPVGTLAVALGLGAIVAGITESHRWGALGTSVAIVLGGALLVPAVLRSARHPEPAVTIDLWRDRGYALAGASSFVFGAAMFAWLLAGPLFLDAIWGYSTLGAAGALSIGAVSSMVTAVAAGRLTTPRARRAAGVLGTLLFTGTLVWMSTDAFGPEPALWTAWVPAGILGGGGVGIVVTVLSAAAASVVPPQRFAAGIGMTLTARQLGGALGVAILAAVFAANPGAPLTALHTVFAIGAGITVLAACLIALPVPAADSRSGETI
ncbi:MFS transporter [Nocardia puris]|uniref:EmrB/QacA subfamily drug resistance transporter n=1 Tax=Nocardia puris TaxID=208602 RepID=A0A366DFT3_9NOCA|nr:MFS transporter [Nocardia puris]RBO88359.1 EmrB/QacA subfamily drug resistance transporter [Nocardia puris]